MNYSCMFDEIRDSTGARQVPNFAVDRSVWGELWSELLKTTAFQGGLFSSTTITKSMAAESMPVWSIEMGRSTADMVRDLQAFFGINVKETADILNVSRPMVYHYQKGMEPAPENKRRLTLLTSFVDEWQSSDASLIQSYLKARQPEGKTLLDYLNEKEVNVVAVREIMRRATVPDRRVREALAKSIVAGETMQQRRDIAQERHAAGKPVYVADLNAPGRIIQVLPDGTRIRGHMVHRKFVPDGE
jgi:predicted transcriptional regulator